MWVCIDMWQVISQNTCVSVIISSTYMRREVERYAPMHIYMRKCMHAYAYIHALAHIYTYIHMNQHIHV